MTRNHLESTLPGKLAQSVPVDGAPALAELKSMALLTHCDREQEICSQGVTAEHWYSVVSGVAREYLVRANGRRQIVDVLLPGDLFGFAARDKYRFAVRSVVSGTVIAHYPRKRFDALANNDQAVGKMFRDQLSRTVERLQEELLVVGRMTAAEKVGNYLLRMSQRLPHLRNKQITLPVSRYDIADALGISVETVSRVLTELKTEGLIRLGRPRQFSIPDRHSLEDAGDKPGGRTDARSSGSQIDHDQCREELAVLQ